MVKTPTRADDILVFITNFWPKVKAAINLVRSDHKRIVAYPRQVIKAKRTYSYFREVR